MSMHELENGSLAAPPRWKAEGGAASDFQLRGFVEALLPRATVEYVGTIRRRTVTLHRFGVSQDGRGNAARGTHARGAAAGGDIVVKIFPTVASAELAFGAGNRLADALEGGPSGVVAVRPVAFAPSLPGFAMRFLPGPTLRDLLVQEPWRLADVMARAGQVLAEIHALGRLRPDEGGTTVLTRRTRALGLPTIAERDLVHRYVDFHAHNLVLLDDGTLVVIDPPPRDEVSHVHHDIVSFIYKAQKCLVMPPWNTARARYLIDVTDAAAGFLRSYFATAGRPITPSDMLMLERYLSLYTTMRSREPRWREDMPHQALFGPLLRQQLRRALREARLSSQAGIGA